MAKHLAFKHLLNLFSTIVMEFLGELLLFYPGAFIRWGANGFKPGKFSYYAKEATQYNVFTAILFIGIIVACVQILKALL